MQAPATPSPVALPAAFLAPLRQHDRVLADVEPSLMPTGLSAGAVLRFKSMMALEGHALQVARMGFDRRYVYEQIALAHTSARDPLRRLALELFQACHQSEQSRLAD